MHRILTGIVVLLALTGQAFANGGYVSGKVIAIRIDYDGKGMVIFDQVVGGDPPSCRHPAYTHALSFDASTAAGKSILATALAAKAMGSVVEAYGRGMCDLYGGQWVEDWLYANVN